MLHLPFKRLKFLFSTTTLAIEKDVQAIVAKIKLLGERRSTITDEEASIELSGLINKLESLQHKVRFAIPQFLDSIAVFSMKLTSICPFAATTIVRGD